MKLLSTILIIFAIGLGLMVGTPIIAAGLGLGIGLGCLFVWLLPFLIIATSDKTTGGEKLAWLLVMFFFSWFAWIFYWLLAPLKQRDDTHHHNRRHRFDRYDDDRYGRSYY